MPEVAAALQANPDAMLELTAGIHDICEPCAHTVAGKCDDLIARYDPSVPKDEYNRRLDERWFAQLGLAEGDCLTAREFCLLVRERRGDLRAIYLQQDEAETASRQDNVAKGIALFLALPLLAG